eukprot:1044091-Pelagomonas_calceolata.AAC.1
MRLDQPCLNKESIPQAYIEDQGPFNNGVEGTSLPSDLSRHKPHGQAWLPPYLPTNEDKSRPSSHGCHTTHTSPPAPSAGLQLAIRDAVRGIEAVTMACGDCTL